MVEAAFDWDAPHVEDGAPEGRLFWGANVAVGVLAIRARRFELEPYAAASVLDAHHGGAHLGMLLRYFGWGGEDSVLSWRAEAVRAGRNYVPGVFDKVYESERVAVPFRAQVPKADLQLSGGWGFRMVVDAQRAAMRWGARLSHGVHRDLALSGFVRMQRPTWSVGASLHKGRLREPRDFFSPASDTWASFEASARLNGGWFAFASLSRLWRIRESGSLGAAVDWVVGLGFAGQKNR